MIPETWTYAQQAVLGSMLIDSRCVSVIMSQSSEDDFVINYQTLYKAIRQLFLSGDTIDPVTVLSVVGNQYRDMILGLMEITPTAANCERYMAVCREQSRMYRIKDLAQQITETSDAGQVSKLLESASGLMADKPNLKITTMADALKSFMERKTKSVSYLTWPIAALNDYIYSEPGDMIVLGGYPSTGKSAWALQCAWHWAKTHKVGFFSLETSSEKLFDRQMSAALQLSMDSIKRSSLSQADWDKVCSMSSEITSRNLELVPAAGMTPADVRAVTMMRGYQIIFVDYLQLLQGNGENRTAQVTSISIALHTMAQSMGVTVVALSQLARQGKQDGPMGMSLLRESGQIEQDADVIMMLRMDDKDEKGVNRILKTVKNKEGMCPELLLAFDGKHQTFSRIQRTAENVSKYVNDGKKARRNNKAMAQVEQQMTLLPDDTPVPF